MSVLLRHPACVPALFSRAAEPEPRPGSARCAWRRLARSAPVLFAASFAAVLLIELPLVDAAAAAAQLALPR